MTLITYPTRVHFADGVLEEALRSELEAHDYYRPLILCEEEAVDSDVAERLYSSLPRRTRPMQLAIGSRDSKYDTADAARKIVDQKQLDVIIAFGSGRAIAHARKCRHVFYVSQQGGSEVAPAPVDIFAVPDVDGLPSPCRSAAAASERLLDAASRSGLPKIVICDPTVMRDASAEAAASAAMDAFSRCIESYLSDAYNPPADGMAIDGLTRAARRLTSDDSALEAEERRELMAASLNATLSQQKGIGPTQVLADVLREPHGNKLTTGALARVLLPAMLSGRTLPEDRREQLTRVLALGNDAFFDEEVEQLLEGLPFAGRLSELGLTHGDIVKASAQIEGPLSTVAHTTADGAMSLLEAVF